LQAQRHLGHFIQQQSATLRLLELAGVAGVRASERTFLVAEQNGFEHVLRNRRAVDRNEGAIGAGRMTMNETRQHFLAGARLARDQHRAIAGSDASRQVGQAARRIGDGHHVFGRRERRALLAHGGLAGLVLEAHVVEVCL
jgi:hypothetical protein